MKTLPLMIAAGTALTAVMAMNAPAFALSMNECSAKWSAAKEQGLVPDTMKWNDFRKVECGPDADPKKITTLQPEEPTAAPTTKAPAGVKFPRSVSSKYASETPAKQRMHTCLDAYYANKEANSLNGLKWIQKGGGYYSLCNAKLKGA